MSEGRAAALERPSSSPSGRLALLALAAVPVAIALRGAPVLQLTVLLWDAALLFAVWAAGRRLAGVVPSCERHHDERLVVGQPNVVRVRLHNPTDTSLRVSVRDDPPSGWTSSEETLSTELPPFARRELTYTVTPDRRGDAAFGDLAIRIERGPGLCRVTARIPAVETVRVYPNVLGPRRYELAARLGELALLGFHPLRRDGGGGEFEKLREYVAGDEWSDIDWRATARRNRPVTRVYQRERSQQVLIAVDASRMMASRLGAITKLDHALNAALLTAWVALRHGDRVGLVVFADEVGAFVAPRAGLVQYRRILETLQPVQPSPTFVDFRRFAEFVRLRVPRRSLLVVFSDLLDEAHALPLAASAAVLTGRHLPVCVTLRDELVLDLSRARPAEPADAYRRAAAADLLDEQEAVRARLRRHGVQLVEAAAGELAVAAVNRYLDLKRRGSL